MPAGERRVSSRAADRWGTSTAGEGGAGEGGAASGASVGSHGRERGSGTVLAVGLAGVLFTLLVAAVTLLGVVAATHRAAAAADLAALAGAQALAEAQTIAGAQALTGEPALTGEQTLAGGQAAAACHRADVIARAHEAVLVECSPRGAEVRIRVQVPLGYGPPGLPTFARGAARAGPSPVGPGEAMP